MSVMELTSKFSGNKVLINPQNITSITQADGYSKIWTVDDKESSFDVSEPIEEIEVLMLRDQFAMSAMNGLLSNSGGVIQANSHRGTGWVNTSAKGTAELAYEIADEMLKARKEQ